MMVCLIQDEIVAGEISFVKHFFRRERPDPCLVLDPESYSGNSVKLALDREIYPPSGIYLEQGPRLG